MRRGVNTGAAAVRRPRRVGSQSRKGAMTVAEAGRKGGSKVRDTHGHEFYVEIGRKGGHKVRDLIAAGKRALKGK